MTPSEKKLNKEYQITIQGGSILVLIKLLLDKVSGIEVALDMADKIGMKLDDETTQLAQESLKAVDAIGHNLMHEARKIFGDDYLHDLFCTDCKGAADKEETVPEGAVIN